MTGLLTPLTDLTGNCSEGPQSLFQWEVARWIGGSWVGVDWAVRRQVQANTMALAIDFTLLQSYVSFSADISELTALQNQVCVAGTNGEGYQQIILFFFIKISLLFD